MNAETNRKYVAVMTLENLEHQPLLVFYLATDQYPPTVIQKLQSDPDFRRNLIFRACLKAIFVPPPQLLIRGEFYIYPCTETVDYSSNPDGEIVVVDLDEEDEVWTAGDAVVRSPRGIAWANRKIKHRRPPPSMACDGIKRKAVHSTAGIRSSGGDNNCLRKNSGYLARSCAVTRRKTTVTSDQPHA